MIILFPPHPHPPHFTPECILSPLAASCTLTWILVFQLWSISSWISASLRLNFFRVHGKIFIHNVHLFPENIFFNRVLVFCEHILLFCNFFLRIYLYANSFFFFLYVSFSELGHKRSRVALKVSYYLQLEGFLPSFTEGKFPQVVWMILHVAHLLYSCTKSGSGKSPTTVQLTLILTLSVLDEGKNFVP